ncbi:MAG: hypothetical protein AAGJ46_08880 [Planctomycetota bacterium]
MNAIRLTTLFAVVAVTPGIAFAGESEVVLCSDIVDGEVAGVKADDKVKLASGCNCHGQQPRIRVYGVPSPSDRRPTAPAPTPAPLPKMVAPPSDAAPIIAPAPRPAEAPPMPIETRPGRPSAIDGPYGMEDRYQIGGDGLDNAPSLSDEQLFPNAAPNAPSTLPAGGGAIARAESPSVHMIGDFFNSGLFLGDDEIGFASTPIGGGDRRFKASDNLSPVPQDRFFFNYHHFENAVIDVTGASRSVDRFTFGLEKTLWDGLASVEVRLPFTSGLQAEQNIQESDNLAAEFGNLAVTFKTRVCETAGWTLSSGLATVLPTAEDASVDTGLTFSTFENNAVHLQPYFGLTYGNPCSRAFSTAYLAFDVDLNGNRLSQEDTSGQLRDLGEFRDQTLLFADWQLGYWCYQDHCHHGYINGVAPVIELHYTRTLEGPDTLPGTLENPFGNIDLLNLTAGIIIDVRRRSLVTIYGAAPLIREEAELFSSSRTTTVSPVFDAEFGVQWAMHY